MFNTGVSMPLDLSAELNRIMEREMKELGTYVLIKQCKSNGIDPDNIHAKELPKLAKALAEVMRSFGGPDKAKAINNEINKLGNLESMIGAEVRKDSKIDMLLSMGDAYISSCEWNKARDHYFQLIGLAEEAHDLALKSMVVSKIALAYRKQGDYDKAFSNYENARDLAKRSKNKAVLAQSLAGMGNIHWRRGEFQVAVKVFEEAKAFADKVKDPGLTGVILIETANVLVDLGDLDKGEQLLKQALENLYKAKDHAELGRAHNNLGDIYLQKEDWEMAIKEFERCEREAEEGGNIQMKAWAAFNSAEAHINLGDLPKAKLFLDNALPMLEQIGDRNGICSVHKVLGQYYSATMEWGKADEAFLKAIWLAQENKTPFLEGLSMFEMARMLLSKRDKANALGYLGDAKAIFKRLEAKKFIEAIVDIESSLVSCKPEA